MRTPATALEHQPNNTAQKADRLPLSGPLRGIDLGRRFDARFAVAAVWVHGGLYLDGWAHYHVAKLETFFTPWRAVLYSGFLVAETYLVWTVAPLRSRPIGYDLSLLGARLFLLGGLADMVWHSAFGIEQSEQALFSPTHPLIATGGVLLVTGPLRACWHRRDRQAGETIPWPALLSLFFALSRFALFVEYSNPFFDPLIASGSAPASPALAFHTEIHGVLGIFVHSALLTGVVLFALRRWTLPTGSLTSLFTGGGALLSVLHDHQTLVPSAFAAGVLGDTSCACSAGRQAGRPACDCSHSPCLSCTTASTCLRSN